MHMAPRQVSEMYFSQKRSVLVSGLLHAAAIVLVLALTGVPTRPVARFVKAVLVIPRDLVLPASRRDGGGGGGVHSPLPASQGRLPRQALRQFTPPQVTAVNPDPRLIMEPTILVAPDIALPKVDLAQYGIPNGVPGPPSGGPGAGGGIGEGDGTGVGNSRGPGYGDGPGGPGFGRANAGFRGSMTGPVVLSKIEPDYSDEARKAHLQGTVVLRIDVDTRGAAQNIRVTQSLGLGLDERAIEAVRRWRFRPAMQNGRPMEAPALIEVFFRLL
ncbi:MAG: energy transducer TonB [Acidobacteriia bacterium]|nr:energy transducer TonB [Terriglobia bacterium]